MRRAYSRLKLVLQDRGLTLAELQRRLARDERAVNVKTLYRLADPDRPLERVDLRVLGAICELLGVGIADLIVFSERATPPMQLFPEPKQRRLDLLMERHSEGALVGTELDELRGLVAEAEQIARSNAGRLARHRRQLRPASPVTRRATAG